MSARPAAVDVRAALVEVRSEKDLQAAVIQLAKVIGWASYHTYDSRRSSPGFPDLVLLRAPRLIFAELKSGGGRLSHSQIAWLLNLEHVPGVETYLWRPTDLDNGTIERTLRGRA